MMGPPLHAAGLSRGHATKGPRDEPPSAPSVPDGLLLLQPVRHGEAREIGQVPSGSGPDRDACGSPMSTAGQPKKFIGARIERGPRSLDDRRRCRPGIGGARLTLNLEALESIGKIEVPGVLLQSSGDVHGGYESPSVLS
jgi:hypothetical protein